MAPATTKSGSANPKAKAKASLLGSKAAKIDSPSSASTALPNRRPFGQEGSDDDEDVDLEFYDANGVSGFAQGADDDEVMIADGPTLDVAQPADAAAAKGKGRGAQDVMMSLDPTNKPSFKPLSKSSAQSARDAIDVTRGQLRKVPIPPHRMTPLKNEWPKIYTPLVEMAGLQVRMNVKRKTVEIKVSTYDEPCCLATASLTYVPCLALLVLETHAGHQHAAERCRLRQGICTWL